MRIVVRTTARLHLGFLDLSGDLGRLFGSIGVAIQAPTLVLEAHPADSLRAEGDGAERVAAYARTFLQHYPLLAGAHLRVVESIPAHVGLGSGTQLALAVGTALARLADQAIPIEEIAHILGRGRRSGVGIAVFRRGGLVVDGGHRTEAGTRRVPPVLFRRSVPRDWYFVVAIPAVARGISGDHENEAFRTLPPAPSYLSARVCRLLVMKMLPALIEENIVRFGQALTEIQTLVGDAFTAVQGGRFMNEVVDALIHHLLHSGAYGAGQSSWGPTVYALAQGQAQAKALAAEAEAFLRPYGGQVLCVRARNRGARVEVVRPSNSSG